MSKMIPKDIVDHQPQPESGELKSNLDVSYDVKIEMLILDNDREEDDNSFQVIDQLGTEIRIQKPDGSQERLYGDWYWFMDEKLCRYVPSRVYYDPTIAQFVLLYYTSPSIRMKPFVENDGVNVLVAKLNPFDKYIYDVRARVVIDQVLGPDGMYLIVLFGDDSADLILGTKL